MTTNPTGQAVTDEQLAEWTRAVSYSYEAGEPPQGTSAEVLALMNPDGGLLAALGMLRAAREQTRRLRERIEAAQAVMVMACEAADGPEAADRLVRVVMARVQQVLNGEGGRVLGGCGG